MSVSVQKLEFSADFLRVFADKTRSNLIVTFVDVREDRALLTYLFDDNAYSRTKIYTLKMAKEAWKEFCERVDFLPEEWISRIEGKIAECLEI